MDGGKTLIHIIDIELDEFTYAQGRLYRPLEAQSLNQRPAVILMATPPYDKDALAPVAIELVRRGFVALTVDHKIEEIAQPDPQTTTEANAWSVLSSASALLKNQTFVDKSRLGFIAYTIDDANIQPDKDLPFFKSIAIITPQDDPKVWEDLTTALSDPKSESKVLILASGQHHKTSIAENNQFPTILSIRNFLAPHFLLPLHPKGIETILTFSQDNLQIPNDLPLWFNPAAQLVQIRAFFLLIAYFALLLAGASLCEIFTRRFPDSETNKNDESHAFIPVAGAILFLYLLLWTLSRVFMLEIRFIGPLLRPIQPQQLPALIGLLLIAVFLFWNSSRIFNSHRSAFHRRLQSILILLLPMLSFFVIEYLPYFVAHRSGWELFLSIVHPGQKMIMHESRLQIMLSTAFSGTLFIGSLLWIQRYLIFRTNKRFNSALFCGTILTWLIASRI